MIMIIVRMFCRQVLVSTLAPQRKNIVIMIDHGNSLSDNQLYTAKAIAKHILLSLGDNDRVSVCNTSVLYMTIIGTYLTAHV